MNINKEDKDETKIKERVTNYGKLRTGGVMRCCIQNLVDWLRSDEFVPPIEGDELKCKYCKSSLHYDRAEVDGENYWNWRG